MHTESLTDVIRPLAWIAVAGFTTGFCGYLALGMHGAALMG